MTVPSDAESLIAAFADALNGRDADALASLFTEDADFVDFLGHWQQDRNAVREGHLRAFANLLSSGRHRSPKCGRVTSAAESRCVTRRG